jgi:hypothetical protein
MLKFLLQLAVWLTGFLALLFVASLLEPVFTNPIVFVVIVSLIALFAIKIAVRS